MSEYKNITQLMREQGCDELRTLGKMYCKETNCGVSLQYVSILDWGYWDIDGSRRYIKRNRTHHYEDIKENYLTPKNGKRTVTGLKFSTIVEGYDAEFSADVISFPTNDEEIDEACAYLAGEVDQFLAGVEQEM